MKKINIILYTFLSFAIFTGCDEGFEELNVDPNSSTAVPAHLLLGGTQLTYMNTMYSAQLGGDMGACWAQQWSKVQYNDEARYVPRRGNMDAVWRNMYSSIISEANAMYNLADAEDNSVLKGASLVMQAVGYQTLVDFFGPIPFTEAINGDILQPAYDTEATVYAGIITMLTDASALLATGNGSITASSDLFYAGDASKWKKLANSLMFRALMRISSTPENQNSKMQGLMGKMFASNEDNAQITYLGAAPDANPIWETIVNGNRAEYKINSVIVDILNGLNDERLAVYAGTNASGAIVGKPSGFGAATTLPNEALGYTYANISPLGDKYLTATLPGVLMSYSQLSFLVAQAANEGYISGGIPMASAWYRQGIAASFAFNGISSATYLAQEAINFSTQSDARSKIATQEWIALFGQGFESWTEWRRNKIPVLTAAAEGDINEIPSRFYYPTTEPSLNGASYNAGVAVIGGDKLTSKLIWQ
ncbi:SusD/RagB family nutrient-binding outer membrane lipoprotein [Polaribacter sp.]|nr:SusD/RagB family nutrient-binding outer membrane lipoprotein [Polaribacter sp.]MDB4098715.1 SusD/RagB family nutrient-binding outer membrane lipoprotein [Polaribacter sp.]MDB4205310.1 SusD/RagB family nutrient-binding outer membrane lipoprotein [Polaribacter sp.]